MPDLQTSPTRLRQIALVTQDLKRATHLLTTIFGTEVVFIDPGVSKWGLENILVAIGGDIIEVVAPFEKDTTAGRLLAKRGQGGYMIIMQTLDATTRRKYLEESGLAKVIYGHEHDGIACVQYHPKGILGGMMPELDSHAPTPDNPTPLATPYSPWHACGKDYASYSAGMKRCAHLKLLGATCRLAVRDNDTGRAAQQWERLFGVERQHSELVFTNARMTFVPGVSRRHEGLESITIGVHGEQRLEKVQEAADQLGLWDGGCIRMLGVEWNVVLLDEESVKSRL